MNSLLRLRKNNGLSQQALADYIGVSRSTVNLAEKGLRELPKTAADKLANIENLVALDEYGKKLAVVTRDEDAIKQLKDYHKMKIDDYLYKAEGLRLQLVDMMKARQKSGAKFKLVKALSKQHPATGKSKVDSIWTEYHEQQSNEKLSKHISIIQMLTFDIEVQKGYAAVHEKVLKRIF